MKKTYIAPAVELVKLNPADIIATSFGVNNQTGDGNQLSRDGFWDEEDW